MNEFIRMLFEPEDIVEVRCLPRKQSAEKPKQFWTFAEDIGDLSAKVSILNKQGYGIFAGILPRSHNSGGEDTDCLPGRVLWADLDGGVTPKKAISRVARLGMPTPTMVVNSGNGTHLYWQLNKKAYPADLSAAVYSLAVYLHGDLKVFNPSRVLRIPGFVNTKDSENPKNCEIISFDESLVYSLSELCSKFPATRIPVAQDESKRLGGASVSSDRFALLKTALNYLEKVPSMTEGSGRNNKAHELAKRLRDKGLSQDEVFIALRDGWDNRNIPPLGADELSTCVRTGFRYARKEAGCEPFDIPEQRTERVRGKKRGEKAPKKKKDKKFTELAMGRYREQAEGKLNVIPLPWPILGEGAPILYPRKVGIITGLPGDGKTFLAMTICDVVQKSGYIAKYLPLEDDLAYYLQRGAAISAKTWEPTRRITTIPEHKRDRFLNRLKVKYQQYFEYWGQIVEENPTLCDDGEIRAIDSEWVLEWAEEQCDAGARLLVIDSLAQIEFSGKEEWKEQATFWRRLLGIANRSNATILLVIHMSKVSKGDFSSIYSGEGSKRFGDLTFSMLGLEQVEEDLTIEEGEALDVQDINRIIHVMKCREGTISKGKIGFKFGDGGPSFVEVGKIHKKSKTKTQGKG
jgi:hypothetical protein